MSCVIFICSVSIIFFAYFGYPASLALISRIRSRSVDKSTIFPSVTFLITAHNEEQRIESKLKETLSLVYPREKLQILVASDGSTDRTESIVRGFEAQGVELVVTSKRGGKEHAQREALERASGEIVVFSDVATMLEPQGISEIVSNFADPTVGCVTSEDRLLARDGRPCGEGAYVRYEMWVRRLESRVNSVVGLSGSLFAARRGVCHDFSGEMQSDFRTLLAAVAMGYRGVSDPSSVGYYYDIADTSKEFGRKVRTVVRGLTVFFSNRQFLNPFRYGFFSYQLFGHKLLRWLVPFFLISTFVTNLILAFSSGVFFVLFSGQVFFYGLVWLEYLLKRPFHSTLLKLPGYFFTVNFAIAMAWAQYFRGHRIVMWTSSER